MSSTNRGEASGTGHKRHPDDAYVTEGRYVRALLRELHAMVGGEEGAPHAFSDYSVCDAGAGAGAILRELKAAKIGGEEVSGKRYGIEKRDDLMAKCLEIGPCALSDYLEYVEAATGEAPALLPFRRPNMVVMNPPYARALEFVAASQKFVRTTKVKDKDERRYATVCALLRLNWMGSKKRIAWHKEHPSLAMVLGHRPSFTADGKTDSSEYAWFVWSDHPKLQPHMGRWRVIDVEDKPRKPRSRAVPTPSASSEEPEVTSDSAPDSEVP